MCMAMNTRITIRAAYTQKFCQDPSDAEATARKVMKKLGRTNFEQLIESE